MNSRKKKCLSISEKKRVIQTVENGQSKKDVAKQFGILPSTLSMILKNKDRIIGSVSNENRKRSRQGEFPRLEECLVEWIRLCREQNLPIGGFILKDKAKFFAQSLGIKGFAASEGWLSNFKNRHCISFKKICGESASEDISICSQWIDNLNQLLNGYDSRDIFNTDETGLFYKCLPDRTLAFKDEKCHGGKLSKDRLTVLLACNMDGSQKLKPLIIGKSEKPRCFEGIKSLPTLYRSNKKSWMTTELFNEWLTSVNSDMKKQKRKILLFLDSCPVHNNPPPLDHVKLIFFPVNTASRLQPLDQGIIQNVKTLYRREIVSLVLDSIEKGEKVNITVLTTIIMIDKAWKNINPTTIYNCFRKCGFKHTESVEQSSEPPKMTNSDSGWGGLPNYGELTFEDYSHVDDDVSVHGADAEILNLDHLDDEDEEEDEGEQPPIPVTLSEARRSLTTLRFYALKLPTRPVSRHTAISTQIISHSNVNIATLKLPTSNILKHRYIHTGNKPFKCEYCDFKIAHQVSLKKHLNIHAGNKPFKCEYCDFRTTYKNALVNHKNAHLGEMPFKCKYCDYTIKYRSHLTDHLSIHTGEKPFKCEYCDYTIKYRSHLTDHLSIHTGEKPFKCKYCDYTIKYRSHLTDHLSIHTGEKPFKCKYCDYTIKYRSHLTDHLSIHTGEKPFKCKYCDYTIKYRSHLTDHLSIHTGEKPFKCKYCDYTIKYRSHLTDHLSIHTGEKPFKCKYCDYTIKYRSHLTDHLSIHTGEKPFKCKYCDYTIKYRSHLTDHLSIHTGEKPFKCEYCDLRTAHQVQMKTLCDLYKSPVQDGQYSAVHRVSSLVTTLRM
ncbi:hypothetical protein LAZ67_10001978 [Cordylochernes scorpioides]|uniref:Uncharacterized protein n=1 Tax=Cordylochernes scorpioides TaxID=51811 RepID=A0ABY6KZP3_9ARAC|nr:hypothetical protein LAZ67_10001978 [Cordylochernes scorpioides]